MTQYTKKQSECRVSWNQVAAFRMRRHQLAGDGKAKLPGLVRALTGVQAQMMSAAELALRVRSESMSQPEIRAALWRDRSLVKTAAMRGTLHLLAASDFSLYISALRPSRMAALLRVMARLGIHAREVESLSEAVITALKSVPRTQLDLTAEMRKQSGKKMRTWLEGAWSFVRPAMVEGLICYGEDQGRESTLVRVDQWLSGYGLVEEETAKQTLLERYLTAYGPATVRDFAFWSGMPTKEAAAVWTSLADRMAEVSLEGRPAFVLSEDRNALREAELQEPVVRLLPHFDVYLLAHAEKDHLVEPKYYKRVYRNQGWISPVVLLNGRIVGTWSRVESKEGLIVKTELFGKITGSERLRLKREVERIKDILSLRR